jgi:hypothetical protein
MLAFPRRPPGEGEDAFTPPASGRRAEAPLTALATLGALASSRRR